MTEHDNLLAELLSTRFVSSWIGRARPGDRHDPDPKRRTAAWANWAVQHLTEMTGAADRTYIALVLEGRYHDPKGNGPLVRPHLELPERVLERPDTEFPDRLAQMGNGLEFPWWLYPEVTATKRALCTQLRGSVGELSDVLNERRGSLVDAVAGLARNAAPAWRTVEELLVTAPDGLSGDACDDFDADVVEKFLPAAARFRLRVTYDPKLRESSQGWASRRIGVWRLEGTDASGDRFSLGVLTPRLTMNSQFHDPLFAIEKESPAALLVRGLQLRRISERHLNTSTRSVSGKVTVTTKPTGHLKAVVAKVGAKLPEASVKSAHAFLTSNPDAEGAWAMLNSWAERTKTLLTVRDDGFAEAHRRATRMIRRGEQPERDDINVLLPIGWNEQSEVVRVTYVRATDAE